MSSFWVGAPRQQAFLTIRTSHVNNKWEVIFFFRKNFFQKKFFFSEKNQPRTAQDVSQKQNLRHVAETSSKSSHYFPVLEDNTNLAGPYKANFLAASPLLLTKRVTKCTKVYKCRYKSCIYKPSTFSSYIPCSDSWKSLEKWAQVQLMAYKENPTKLILNDTEMLYLQCCWSFAFCYRAHLLPKCRWMASVFWHLSSKGEVMLLLSYPLSCNKQVRYMENKQPQLIFQWTYWLRCFSACFCSDRSVSSHLANSFQRKQKVRQEFPLLCPASNNSQAQNQALGWIPAVELRFYTMRRSFPFYPACCSTPSMICNRDCILFLITKTEAGHPPAHPTALKPLPICSRGILQVTATPTTWPPRALSLSVLSLPAPNLAILTAGISVRLRVELYPSSCIFPAGTNQSREDQRLTLS